MKAYEVWDTLSEIRMTTVSAIGLDEGPLFDRIETAYNNALLTTAMVEIYLHQKSGIEREQLESHDNTVIESFKKTCNTILKEDGKDEQL